MCSTWHYFHMIKLSILVDTVHFYKDHICMARYNINIDYNILYNNIHMKHSLRYIL
jgi:hypothetical protein